MRKDPISSPAVESFRPFAAVPVGLMVIRLRLEEQFLERTLPGYRAYLARVPYRLVPGIW